jgi:hypothetical protein
MIGRLKRALRRLALLQFLDSNGRRRYRNSRQSGSDERPGVSQRTDDFSGAAYFPQSSIVLTRMRVSLRSEFLGGLTECEEQSAIADDTKAHTIVRTSRLQVHNRPQLSQVTLSSDSKCTNIPIISPLSYLKKLTRQESDWPRVDLRAANRPLV